jgi:ABC-type transporter Mla subunit MlaD
MKIHTATAWMLCCVALTTSACVMSSTYNEAVTDLDATKAEIDSTRTQSKVLTEQVNELQQLKVELARQKEEISLAVQQAQHSMQAEHAASQSRLNRLSRAISQLNAQQRRLLYALQRANEERPELQSMVEGYKSKLGEVDGPGGALSPTPIVPTNEQAGTALAPPSQVAAQTAPVPNPTVTTPPAPTDPAAVNPKPQPPNKQTSEPVEDDWLSTLKGWVIAFWQSIFS